MALLEVKQDVRDAAVVVSAGGEIDSGTVDTLVSHLDAALEAASRSPVPAARRSNWAMSRTSVARD